MRISGDARFAGHRVPAYRILPGEDTISRMPKLVLIADDSAVARASVAREVRAAALDIIEASTAASAASMNPAKLACALLDLDLGDGNGPDVAEGLRAEDAALPIAFFSAQREGAVLARARTIGPVFSKQSELNAAIAWIRANARA